MKIWVKDLILSIILLLFSAVSFVYAVAIQDTTIVYFLAKADTYVLLWLSCLFLLSLLLLIRTLKKTREEPQEDQRGKPIITKLSVFTLLAMVVYVILMPRIGFVPASILMLLVMFGGYSCAQHGAVPKGKTLIRSVIIWGLLSVTVTFFVDAIFSRLLGVSLP